MPINQKTLLRILTAALILQVISVCYYVYYIHFFGYLPAPFVSDKSDTFMDLYNTMWWGALDGRYTEWRSIYPPLNFMFLDLMRLVLVPSGVGSDPIHLRATDLWPALVITALHVAAPVFIVTRASWRGLSDANRALIAAVSILSPVLLFSIERGNLIILAIFFLPSIFSDRSDWWRPLLLAIIINLKPYLAPLVFAYALVGNWRSVLQCLAFSGAIFLLTGLTEDPNFPLFLNNIKGFADSAVLQPRQLLALPASPSALTRAILMLLNTPDGAASHFPFLAALPPLIEVIKTGAVILALCSLFLRRQSARTSEAFVVLMAVIVTVGIWAGGYSQIFYLAAVPVLLAMRLGKAYLLIVLAIFLPWDLVTLHTEPGGPSISFITHRAVTADWQIGLGSIARPILNTLLLIMLGIEFITRKAASIEKSDAADRLWDLLPEWRVILPAGVVGLALGAALYQLVLSSQTAVTVVQMDAGPATQDTAGFLTSMLERRTVPQLVASRLVSQEAGREITAEMSTPIIGNKPAGQNDIDGAITTQLSSDARYLKISVKLKEGAVSVGVAAHAAAMAITLNNKALSAGHTDIRGNWKDTNLAGAISAALSDEIADLQGEKIGASTEAKFQSGIVVQPTLTRPMIEDWRMAALIGAIACGSLAYGLTLSRKRAAARI